MCKKVRNESTLQYFSTGTNLNMVFNALVVVLKQHLIWTMNIKEYSSLAASLVSVKDGIKSCRHRKYASRGGSPRRNIQKKSGGRAREEISLHSSNINIDGKCRVMPKKRHIATPTANPTKNHANHPFHHAQQGVGPHCHYRKGLKIIEITVLSLRTSGYISRNCGRATKVPKGKRRLHRCSTHSPKEI